MKTLPFTFISSLTFLLVGCSEKAPAPPNIIFILADDLGYGDVGCNGQKLIPTPNIDRLAKDGMLFTQHYSGSTVSAPSRSSLMTGQHTGKTFIRGNKSMKPEEGQYPLEGKAVTIPEILQKAGYATGAFGKWGLGPVGSEGDPLAQGFDEFFGYICQGLAHSYYPGHLWHNGNKIILEENRDSLDGIYAPSLIHEKTLEFIEKNKENSFFCYVPTIIPHAELIAPEKYIQLFRNKFLPEKVFEGCDPGCDRYRTGGYRSQTESHAAFAAMVYLLDEQVGQIVKKLEELGICDNTIIMFSSDNGPHLEGGADPDFFNSNGSLKGYKRDFYEGGIRVPMLIKWPKKIKPGSKTDHISAFWDILPTITEIIGQTPPKDINGISFLPTLLNKGKQKQHDYLYWEFYELGGRRALRQGNWKVVQYNVIKNPDGPVMLFNISDDPGEEKDLAAENPGKVLELKKLMLQAHTPSEIWKWEK